jgi:hypothetical protein
MQLRLRDIIVRLLPDGRATVERLFPNAPRRGSRLSISLFFILLALAARPALSDTVDATAAGSGVAKSEYWMLDPTPDEKMRSFSPDRPGKSQSPVYGRWRSFSDPVGFSDVYP